jgi:hypothetical protein
MTNARHQNPFPFFLASFPARKHSGVDARSASDLFCTLLKLLFLPRTVKYPPGGDASPRVTGRQGTRLETDGAALPSSFRRRGIAGQSKKLQPPTSIIERTATTASTTQMAAGKLPWCVLGSFFPCTEHMKGGLQKPLKLNATSCKALQEFALARSVCVARRSGRTKPPRSLRPALGAVSERRLTRSAANIFPPLFRLRSWSQSWRGARNYSLRRDGASCSGSVWLGFQKDDLRSRHAPREGVFHCGQGHQRTH